MGLIKEKKKMEFSIKLAGGVLDDPVFHLWGDIKKEEGGLIKVKNKLSLKFILGDLKPLRPCFFPLRVPAGWVQNGKFHHFYFETIPYEQTQMTNFA